MMPGWISDLIPLAPWAAVIALAVYVIVRIFPYARKVMHFIDDVAGEPARPGVPARPGLMERVTRIEHELFPNGGGSTRDVIDQTRQAVARIQDKLDNDHARLNQIEDTLEHSQPGRKKQ